MNVIILINEIIIFILYFKTALQLAKLVEKFIIKINLPLSVLLVFIIKKENLIRFKENVCVIQVISNSEATLSVKNLIPIEISIYLSKNLNIKI